MEKQTALFSSQKGTLPINTIQTFFFFDQIVLVSKKYPFVKKILTLQC